MILKIRKQSRVLGRNKLFTLFLIFLIYISSIIHTYDFQIAGENSYHGMMPWEMSFMGWIFLGIILLFIIFFTSRLTGNPSDFFVVFYSAVPLISFCALTSTSGRVIESIFLPSLLIVSFPLVSLFLAKYFLPKIRWYGFVSSNIIDFTVIGLLCCTILYSFINSPPSASFEIINSYERRLEGREIYPAGSIIAYLLAMSINGVSPYLAFKGYANRRSSLVLIAFFSAIFFYWLIGVKAQIAYVLVGCLVGYLAGRNYLKYFAKCFLIAVIVLYFIVLIEWELFDNYSIIADYIFRRLFPVQAEVQGYYLDYLMINTPPFWNLFYGVSDQGFSTTYFIGSNYIGNPDANVNTNAFLYAFAANGILGYLVATTFVSIFLVVLDRLYLSTKNPTYMLIGFVYGYLVTEQAFSTAILSSGVGLLFLLGLVEKYKFSDTHAIDRMLQR